MNKQLFMDSLTGRNKDTKELGKDILTTIVASTAASKLQGLSAVPALAPISKLSKSDSAILNYMDTPNATDMAEGIGDRVRVGDKTLREYLLEKGITLSERTKFKPGVSPHFDPLSKYIRTGFKKGTKEDFIKGIVGHEVGHAIRHHEGKLSPSRYAKSLTYGNCAIIPGLVRGAMTDFGIIPSARGREVAAWTALSLLAYSPVLHEEFQASRLGGKLVGLKGLKRLRSFVGLPSYLLAASTPAIAYGVRKGIEKARGE